ncbi:IS21 family transposase [Kitasatospora sp. NPDC049285]|uniref:Mu transposase domain-containing protein n=1 Tax=Kitasatospora sp. NPDC049285 TaxID=3157096 RepID=UPI00342AB316
MLSRREYLEAVSLHRQGWSIIKISRHLGRDRKTVRSYLRGKRTPGIRISSQDAFLQFLPYCRRRLAEDPHLAATALFDEVVDLGYPGGYSTFTRGLRRHQARPACEQCQDAVTVARSRPAARRSEEAVEFDWLRLPEPPTGWGYGNRACLLLASLTGSGTDADDGLGRWSVALAEDQELPNLVEAVDLVLRRLGGTAGCWRFGRTPAMWCPTTNRVTPAFRQVAGHYGARIECRLPTDHRSHTRRTLDRALRSWWRGVTNDTTLQDAQGSLNRLAANLDSRRRRTDDAPHPEVGSRCVDTAALREMPVLPFPARVRARRTITAQGLVPFRGNFYVVPDHLAGAQVEVCRRLDQARLSIETPGGAVIARYSLAPTGAGLTVERSSAVAVLERRPVPAPATTPSCRRNTPRPPSPQALAEAAVLRARFKVPPSRRPDEEQDITTPRVPPQRDRPADDAGS